MPLIINNEKPKQEPRERVWFGNMDVKRMDVSCGNFDFRVDVKRGRIDFLTLPVDLSLVDVLEIERAFEELKPLLQEEKENEKEET